MLRRLFGRGKREDDLERELRSHLQAELDEQLAEGVPLDEARYAARRALGNELLIKEDTRAAWGSRALDALLVDLRLGLRLLARNAAFAVFSVASLALGIGGASAVFSLFDAIVLQELPVPEPGQLITLKFTIPDRAPNYSLPYPHFERMRKDNATLRGLFAWTTVQRVNVGTKEDTQVASAGAVTGDYYATLGLRPGLGRLLTREDDVPGQAAVAILSHGYWQRRFGGSHAVLGSGIHVNQIPFTVVGVEPRGFQGVSVGASTDLVIPIRTLDLLNERRSAWDEPFATWIEVMGRRRPGVSLAETSRELNAIFRSVNAAAALAAPANPFAARIARESNLIVEPGARGGASGLRHGYERWLRLLLAMLAVVLLLACLNVATLLLARSEARRSEIATRMALGAGRWRLVRQLVTEAGVIAALGGSLGVLLASWMSRALLRLATANNETLPLDLSPSPGAIAFSALVSCLSCLVIGVLPALRATSLRPGPAARQIGAGQRRVLDRALVGLQVGLSLVLLVFASLFGRSLRNLWAIDPGYERGGVLMFSVDARLAGKRGAEIPGTYRRLLEELGALPQARSVSVSSVRPVSDGYYFIGTVTQVGEQSFPEDQPVRIAYNNVSPGYFRTIGLPLVAGRDFARADDAGSTRVAIVSEKLARRFAGSAIGQTLRLGRNDLREVVAIARDSRYARITDAPRDVVYLPLFQASPESMWYSPTFEIRHSGSSGELGLRVRDVVARVEPRLPLFRVETLEEQTRASLARERLLALLTGYAAGFALLLAGIGLYGLITCSVRQRTPELGLRMALGARAAHIGWLVVRDNALTVAAGALAGLLGCLAAVRLVQSQLHGTEATDPVPLAAAVATLFALAVVASYVPARRAVRIDPMTALRAE